MYEPCRYDRRAAALCEECAAPVTGGATYCGPCASARNEQQQRDPEAHRGGRPPTLCRTTCPRRLHELRQTGPGAAQCQACRDAPRDRMQYLPSAELLYAPMPNHSSSGVDIALIVVEVQVEPALDQPGGHGTECRTRSPPPTCGLNGQIFSRSTRPRHMLISWSSCHEPNPILADAAAATCGPVPSTSRDPRTK